VCTPLQSKPAEFATRSLATDLEVLAARVSCSAQSGALEVTPGVWVYQITKNGLALQLTLQGTKYYKDEDLNKA
jgi:hypothetical protein